MTERNLNKQGKYVKATEYGIINTEPVLSISKYMRHIFGLTIRHIAAPSPRSCQHSLSEGIHGSLLIVLLDVIDYLRIAFTSSATPSAATAPTATSTTAGSSWWHKFSGWRPFGRRPLHVA